MSRVRQMSKGATVQVMKKPAMKEARACIGTPSFNVPLLAGVRLFLFGARDQLNSYDLRHLSEVPDGERPPAPADLTNIANYFRQSPSSSGGLDAVALGLCGCEVDKPVVFALRTLTIVGTDTVRISKVAVDMTLMPHLPLQSLLDLFSAQVPRFARQLLPGVRYVACERAMPINAHGLFIDNQVLANGIWDPDSQRHLPFEIWQPGPGYASVFPANATGVAFLRADLNAPGAAATA